MQGKKIISLDRPVETTKGALTQIALREPTFADFMALGETHVYGRNPDGTIYSAESIEIIRRYIERLCDCDPLALEQLSFRDTRKLKDAVMDFFAESNLPPSEKSGTGSSSMQGSSTQKPAGK